MANDPSKRKVCMVTYCETPAHLPPMLNEAVSLASAGFEVEAICLSAGAHTAPVETHTDGFWTRRIKVRSRDLFRSLGKTASRGLGALQYAVSYSEYVSKALAAAMRSDADVYEANDLPPLLPTVLAAKLRGKPVVYRAHELWSETHAKVRLGWFWRQMDRMLVPRCDEVVTPEENRSRIYYEEFGAKRLPLTIRNCPPYRPPITSTRLKDELTRRGFKFSTVVLYQGLFDSMRCIEEIAEATRYFDPGVVLVMIGSGFGKWADAEKILAEYDRIAVLPRVAYADLPPYTASADMGILLYRNDCRNNFFCAPNKVFEYMMMGLPIVAANHPGMIPIVEGEKVGLCVDPESPRAIAHAVNRIAGDPQLRAKMKENGLRLSRERYNWANEFRPLHERYRTLTSGGTDS